jgi:hypothetical protein
MNPSKKAVIPKALTNDEVRVALARLDIPLPVRFVPAARPDLEPKMLLVEVCGNGIYLVRSTPDGRAKKVQEKKFEWTCTCIAWGKARGVDCNHIKWVKDFLRNGAPYSNASRRDCIRYIYAEGRKVENTRRENAFIDMPTRVPEIFRALCSRIARSFPRVGRPAIPLAVFAYALLMKCYRRCTYAELSALLHRDPNVEVLGWKQSTPICVNSLSTRLADSRLVNEWFEMIRREARTVRLIETEAAVDSSGLTLVQVANYNEEKHGGAPRSRKRRPYLKIHWLVGIITNIISAVDLSLHMGLGSGDAPHLRGLHRVAKAVWQLLRRSTADKIYGTPGNCRAIEAMKIILITRAKRNEQRDDVEKWGKQAGEVAALERDDEVAFQNAYRFRNKSETAPRRYKGRNPHQRLRRRKADIDRGPAPFMGSDDTLCDLSDERLQEVIDWAFAGVGTAQANEALAAVVVENVRAIVTLEHLHDDWVDFRTDFAFEPIRTVTEEELGLAS